MVAPLLLAGTPGWLLAAVLERAPRLTAALRRLTGVWCAFALYSATLAAWHVPVLYNTMMAHHPVHIAMHLMLLAVAVVSWWPVLGTADDLLPRPSPPTRM